MAAITAARNGAKVTLLEKNRQTGKNCWSLETGDVILPTGIRNYPIIGQTGRIW